MTNEALFPQEALVEILEIDGTTPLNVSTDIDSFSESGFERDVETRDFFHNGKVSITQSQADGELSMNLKVTRSIWDEMLWGNSGSDFTSGGTQKKYRITFCVSKDPAILGSSSVATQALASDYDHYRKIYAEARMTSFNPGLEMDGMLEGEATFNIPPTDASGDANVRVQIGSGAFSEIGSYTSAQKWDA